jgi:glucuronokinase
VDRSFDAGRRMLELDARHVEMVQCARASGASANYTGSGGAIIAVCPDVAIRSDARRALKALGCQVY